MEKQPKPHKKKLPPSELYLEDIISIFELFEGENENCTMEFELDDAIYKLKDKSELVELTALKGKESNTLSFRSDGPKGYFHLDLDAFQADVYAAEDTPFGRGCVEKIHSLIESKRRKLAKLLGGFHGFAFSIVLIVMGISDLSDEPALFPAYAVAVGAFWWYYAFIYMFKKYSIIHFEEKAIRRSFFERNKDQIVLVAFSALVGAVVTLVMTSLF